MINSESRERPRQRNETTANGFDRREAVARLFAEVNSLAIRLRTAVGLRHREGERPAGELSVLEVLQRYGSQTVPQIAGIRNTSRQNTQVLVNRMVADRLVETVPNPAHRRSRLVQLTAAGRAWIESASERQDRRFESVLAEVDETRLAAAATCLREIRQLLTEEQPRRGAEAGRRGSVRALERESVNRESDADALDVQGSKKKGSKEGGRGAQMPSTPERPEPLPAVVEETELPVSLL